MKRNDDTQVSWEEVEKIYEEILKDFSELEELNAKCLFGIPASKQKESFKERYEWSVKNRAGDPYAVLKGMVDYAKTVLPLCAKITAGEWVLKSIIRESGRNCFVN